ncbi:hypothetical protein NST99_08540 [Paenibacillus sp. FSL L8-0470]|uniref:hypothetical protein n=1 Tax=unclassified Paenibacillus TaxID=185978 RepID=UPI0030F71E08
MVKQEWGLLSVSNVAGSLKNHNSKAEKAYAYRSVERMPESLYDERTVTRKDRKEGA